MPLLKRKSEQDQYSETNTDLHNNRESEVKKSDDDLDDLDFGEATDGTDEELIAALGYYDDEAARKPSQELIDAIAQLEEYKRCRCISI